MRDADKLHEKIELSLDNGQVVSLVIGSLVVMGVVFVLGVMVGKSLATQPPGEPRDPLAALDRAAETPPKPPAKPAELTYQHELVQPSPPPTLDGPKPGVPNVPTPAEPRKPDPAPAVVAVAKPEPKPEPVVAPPKPEPKPEPKKPDPVVVKKPEPKPVAPPTSGYTIQVAASQDRKEADLVIAKLKGAGMAPYVVEADVAGKGHYFRVRVGSFTGKAEAEKYAHDLKRETGLPGFVTAVK
jgi:cell division protein FtsN